MQDGATPGHILSSKNCIAGFNFVDEIELSLSVCLMVLICADLTGQKKAGKEELSAAQLEAVTTLVSYGFSEAGVLIIQHH